MIDIVLVINVYCQIKYMLCCVTLRFGSRLKYTEKHDNEICVTIEANNPSYSQISLIKDCRKHKTTFGVFKVIVRILIVEHKKR